MKKIIINASILNNKPSGLGIYTMNVLKHLTKYIDVDKSFVCTSSNKLDNIYNCIKLNEKISPGYGKFAGLYRFIWTQTKFVYKYHNKKEIVYCPTQYASLLSKNRQIITIHDIIPIKFPKQNKMQYLYYRYFLPILLNKCEDIITISNNTKEDLVKFYKIKEEKIHVIYNGYDESLFNNDECDKNYFRDKFNLNKYILIVGASFPHKNIDNYIKSYSLIKDKVEEKLVIVGGRKEYKEYLKKICKVNNVENDVIFMPYLNDYEISLLYKNATLMIYPTLYEGFGLPAIESMACGIPVLMSNTSSLPEIGENAAEYFDPYSIQDMAEKTVLLIKNEKLRNELSKKGLENVKRFSWDETAKNIAKILNK